MKKIIPIALITVAICGVILIISNQGRTTTHPIETVTAAINAGAKTSGTTVMEERSVSGQSRGGRFQAITDWISDAIGREVFDDVVAFLVRDTTGDIRIIVHHRNGDAAQIQILADTHLLKTASVIKSEILTTLPGIVCSVEIH